MRPGRVWRSSEASEARAETAPEHGSTQGEGRPDVNNKIFLIDVVTLIILPSAGIITMLSLTPSLQVVLDLLQIPFDGKEDVRMNELMRLAHQFLQNFCLGNQNNQVRRETLSITTDNPDSKD